MRAEESWDTLCLEHRRGKILWKGMLAGERPVWKRRQHEAEGEAGPHRNCNRGIQRVLLLVSEYQMQKMYQKITLKREKGFILVNSLGVSVVTSLFYV